MELDARQLAMLDLAAGHGESGHGAEGGGTASTPNPDAAC